MLELTRTLTKVNSTPSSTNQPTAASKQEECIESVEWWMRSNRLKLNSYKTQLMHVVWVQATANLGTPHQTIILNLRKESGSDFDPELGMDLHVNNIAL